MAELNPPLGTTTPEIFMDNVKRADRLVNGPAETVNDRGGEPLDTWRGMMAKNDEVRQNIIPLDKQRKDLAEAQADIANIPPGSSTYVRSPDGSALAIEYMNVDGTLEPTGRKMPSQTVIDSLTDIVGEINSVSASLKYITSVLKQFTCPGYQFLLPSSAGPSETLLAIDDNAGLLLAGLKAAVQEYVSQLLPSSTANRYQGYQHVIVDSTGRYGLLTIDDAGNTQIAGMDDALQDRLSSICSTVFSGRIVGYQHVIFSRDLKTAIFAIDDDGGVHVPGVDGPIQDNLGESLAGLKTVNGRPAATWRGDIVWSERPVLTAQKLTTTGLVFSYLPGGEATAGAGVMYIPSIREMPIGAGEIHGGGSAGQSLNLPADLVNSNIVNSDPVFRGRALAGANGRPEGGNLTPVSAADLANSNDLHYPTYRQGNILPMYNALLDQVAADIVFFHAPFAAGGRSFVQISKGTVPYQNGLDFVQLGKDAADGVGKPYVFKFLTFEHGETDNDNGSSQNPGDYLALMTPYFAGLQADFLAITEQSVEFLEVVGQVGSRINTQAGAVDDEGNPTGETVVVQPYSVPATDQLEYVRQNPETAIMYGPKYPLNWLYSDGSLSHLNAAGKVLQGEYTAQAIYWQLYGGNRAGTWTGVKAKSLSLSGATLDIVFDVPYPPLVIDTTTIADCDGRGFSFQNGSAVVQAVTVVGNDTIRLTLDQAPSDTDHLLIGFTNTTAHSNGSIYPLVCVRDSSTVTSRWVTRNSNPFPLYNWACLDRLPLNGDF